ncbi:MAG: calcium/sodium antiporter [Spirochaetales bacterium]|nr:calcium/sodium antiporter [Spirochaetales bacterium]
MNFIWPISQVGLGLVGLYFGGAFLVGGAVGVAKRLHISAIVIGLTIVAFGTSAPEAFVSSLASYENRAGVALGNIIGSNTINIALILGITAVFMPVPISKGLIRRDIPVMFLAYAGFIWAMLSGNIGRIEGLVLILLLVAYVLLLYFQSRKKQDEKIDLIDLHELDTVSDHESWSVLFAKILGGIVFLALGADFLVDGASWLAINLFKASERFVGITVVAFGTSLPELVTSVVAMTKKETDISVGNIIGSNIFNIFFVAGTAAIIRPIPGELSLYLVDLVFMIGISSLLLLAASIFKRLTRITGVLFLGIYGVYFLTLLQSRVV